MRMDKKELTQIVRDAIDAVCLKAGPDAWQHGRETLVKVRLPVEVSELLKETIKRLCGPGANLAEFESAVINALVWDGLMFKLATKDTDKILDRLVEMINGQE